MMKLPFAEYNQSRLVLHDFEYINNTFQTDDTKTDCFISAIKGFGFSVLCLQIIRFLEF